MRVKTPTAAARSSWSRPRNPSSSQNSPPTHTPTAVMCTHCATMLSNHTEDGEAAWPAATCTSTAAAPAAPSTHRLQRAGHRSTSTTARMQNPRATPSASRSPPSRVWNSGSSVLAPTSIFSPQVSRASATTPATAAARSTGTPPRGNEPPYANRLVDAAPTKTASAA